MSVLLAPLKQPRPPQPRGAGHKTGGSISLSRILCQCSPLQHQKYLQILCNSSSEGSGTLGPFSALGLLLFGVLEDGNTEKRK